MDNRRLAVEILIADLYAEVLWSQHQKYLGRNRAATCEYWHLRMIQAQQRLAEAHQRHLQACAELGPADIRVRRRRLSDDHEFVVRDACGFIRWIGNGYWRATEALDAGRDTAITLGLDVA